MIIDIIRVLYNFTNPPKTFDLAIITSSLQSSFDSTVQPDSSQDTKCCLYDDMSVIGAP